MEEIYEEIPRAILTDTNEKHIAKFSRGSRDNHWWHNDYVQQSRITDLQK